MSEEENLKRVRRILSALPETKKTTLAWRADFLRAQEGLLKCKSAQSN